MCNCSYKINASIRSIEKLEANNEILVAFKDTPEYDTYVNTFGYEIIGDDAQLISFNGTTNLALWLPTKKDSTKKQVLTALFIKEFTKQFPVILVLDTQGSFDNLVDSTADFVMYLVDQTKLMRISSQNGEISRITFDYPYYLPKIQNNDSHLQRTLNCIGATIVGWYNNNQWGSITACLIDVEICFWMLFADCWYSTGGGPIVVQPSSTGR